MLDSKRWQRLLIPAALCAVLGAAHAAADEPAKKAEPAKKQEPAKAPAKARTLASDAGGSDQDSRRAELDAARRRLAEAANEVARLSAGVYGSEQHVRMLAMPFGNRKVMLGVLIGGEADGKGVPVAGVTPGGPAEKAGLREEDVIVRIDGVDLAAESVDDALERMTDHLAELEPGKQVEVEILRGSERLTEEVELTPPSEFNFRVGPFPGMGPGFHVLPGGPGGPGGPAGPGVHTFIRRELLENPVFSDLELVPVTEGLGRYFGTSEGLLVVRAPKDERVGLEDGDVILEIDGREPKDPAHAVRILGSYSEGESLSLKIQRSRSVRTVDIKL